MRPLCYSLFLFLFLSVSSCKTVYPFVPDSTARQPKFDTSYIHDYKDLLSARIYFLIQDTRLVFDPDGAEQIIFKPNLPYKVGIGGFYKWFGLGLAIGSPFYVRDEDKQGHTEAFDLRLNLYSNVFAVEGYLQSLKGFYTSNYADAAGDPYLNPGLRVFAIGATGFYVLNYKKYSLRSVFIQNEWQKRSAGSFMARLGFNFSGMESDSGFLPPDMVRDYTLDSAVNYSEGKLVSLSLAPGYSYNLVFLKRCYLHAGAFAGAQYNHISGKSVSGTEKIDIAALLIYLRGAVGYVGKKFHIGFSAILPGFQPFASGPINYFWDPPQYRLWVGTRFDWFTKKNKKKQYL